MTELRIGYDETGGQTRVCISGSNDLTTEIAMKAMAYVLAYIEENEPSASGKFLEKLQLDDSGTINFYDTALFKLGVLYGQKSSSTQTSTPNAES